MPGPPAHLKLGRHDLRRFQKDNPLFTRHQKRKMKQAVKHGARSVVMRLFGLKQKKIKFGTKTRKTQPVSHRSSAPASGVRSDVVSALTNQGYSRKAAESMVPAAQGGDTFDSLFRRAMARRNPELSAKDRENFRKAVEFFKGFHGSDPKRVIRKEATIIESGDYSMIGKLVGYDLSEFPIESFAKVQPNMRVKDHLIEDKKDPIMLCGGTLERVLVEELDYIPPWVKPDKDGKVLVAHQLMVSGGNQDLEPVLESHFGITSTADLLILGELTNIWYLAKKKQDDYQLTNYHHTFGEEEETLALKRAARPWLMYDRVHKKQFIVGGNYSIALEGIRN